MKKLAIFVAIATAAASGAFAQEPTPLQPDQAQVDARKPVAMTEAQMDQVTAGALINVALVDVVDVRDVNVQVAVPVNASVAVGVLGGAVSGALQRPGRQIGF
jgi:hypothetical protein